MITLGGRTIKKKDIICMMMIVFKWINGQEPPIEFESNQSTLQAFYFFTDVTLNGEPIESDDWVAAFKGDLCVGSRQWDTSNCGGGLCDVPAMGDDGSDYAVGYMQNGDIPTFKIFDTSTGNIFDASPSVEVDGWSNMIFFMNDLLEAEWSINSADFQYNGSITSKVFLNDNEVGTADDVLMAFVGDEIRGVINGLAVPSQLGEGYSFNIMIFSNQLDGETVEFKFYQEFSNSVVSLNETIIFESDMVIGNVLEPFIFTGDIVEGEDIAGCTDYSACNYNADATDHDGSCEYFDACYECGGNETDASNCLSIDTQYINDFSINSIYPNPFNPVVNIDLSIDIAGYLQLSVFTIEGAQIKTIYNGPSSIGESAFTWRPENRASGLYLITANLKGSMYTKKVLYQK